MILTQLIELPWSVVKLNLKFIHGWSFIKLWIWTHLTHGNYNNISQLHEEDSFTNTNPTDETKMASDREVKDLHSLVSDWGALGLLQKLVLIVFVEQSWQPAPAFSPSPLHLDDTHAETEVKVQQLFVGDFMRVSRTMVSSLLWFYTTQWTGVKPHYNLYMSSRVDLILCLKNKMCQR